MAARKKTTAKTQTIAEFKAWIEGIEELQPKDWCPDPSQWKLIRKKISQIVSTEPAPRQFVPQPAQQFTPPPTAFQAPVPQGGVPNGEIVRTPVAPAGAAAELLKSKGPDTPVKTPDVEGKFASPFA